MNAIKNLLSGYLVNKDLYRVDLNSDREVVRTHAKQHIRDNLRRLMRDNIDSSNANAWRLNYRIRHGATLSDLLVWQTAYDKIGAKFRTAIQDSDASDLVDYLNDGGLVCRTIRDSGDWANRIEEKIGSQYYVCEDCSALEYEDNCTWAYNGDRVICESCCGRNYHWSDYRDTYIHDDDEDDDNDNGLIGEYHSSSDRLDHIPTIHDQHKNPIYLGLELEMETTDGADRYSKAEQLLDAIGRYSNGTSSHQYCLLENDGSLDDGFEMVSAWTGLDVHAKQLEFFKQPFRGMRSHDTRTCGLHIHICKTGMTMAHASKLILFINESGNQKLIKAIARRENPDYAKIKNKRADYRWLKNAKQRDGIKYQLMQLNEDRYEALNFKNPNTIEFRMFRGTLKYETIMACLEFTYASWHFARDTGISNLSTDDFLAYISKPAQLKTTKFLRSYLQEKGFNVPTPVKKNPRIESPATNSETVEI